MRRRVLPEDDVNARRRATLSDVARRAGVSPVTVSRAIRHPEMVSEDLRTRIDEAVRALNYIPNSLAAALASTKTRIVGVVVPSLTNSVFDDYLSGIQDVLDKAGIQMLVSNSRYSEKEEEKAIQTLLGYHPEAMIVVGVDQSVRARQLLKNSAAPVVQTMDVTADPIDLNVGFDHRAGGAAAVRFLLDMGHRRIGHLTVRTDPRAGRRLEGYLKEMYDHGLSTEGMVAASPYSTSVQRGSELFAELIERRPDTTAVFTCNDDLALGALFECQRRGIRVPQDVSIIGFNDLDFGQSAVPSLSSVSTERRKVGTWAAEAIVEIIRGSGRRPRQTTVDMGLRIEARGSTAPLKAPKRKKPD